MLHRYLRRSFGTLTAKNWDTESPRFLAALEKAEFVTFDFELTGLYTKPSDRFIGVDACYEGYSEGVKAFQPVQLGICTGRRDASGTWILTPISAFMLPADEDAIFSTSAATLSFLVQNGIDLNAWISQGVRWLTLAQESERRAAIQQRIEETRALRDAACSAPVKPAPAKPVELPHEQDRILVESVRKQIEAWLISGAEEPLEIEMESAFHRLLLHTVIGQEFPQIFSLSGKKGDSRVLTVFKSKGELHAKQLSALNLEISKINSGPRLFFDVIAKRKIPVIGHNCLVDILHACKLFEDLPTDLLSFKARVAKIVPLIYDTRILTEQANAPATLRDLFEQMAREATDVKIESDSETYRLPASCSHLTSGAVGNDKSHDAGYDALMTALIFILNSDSALKHGGVAWGPNSMAQLESLYKHCANKVRLVRTQPPVLNLTVRDCGRSFRIDKLPEGWDKWKLLSVFAPVNFSIEIDGSSARLSVASEMEGQSLMKLYKINNLQSTFDLIETP